MGKKVLLRDIAKESGVSTALVSFVLDGKALVTRIRCEITHNITRLAKKLNYQPNQIARSLRQESTETIGLMSICLIV